MKCGSQKLINAPKLHSKDFRVSKIVESGFKAFLQNLEVKNDYLCLNAASNSFISGCINSENVPRTISRKPCKLKMHKMHLNIIANICFQTHKSWKCAQNFFSNFARRKLPIRLNYTANSFVSQHTQIIKKCAKSCQKQQIVKNVPIFYKPCKLKTSKMCLNTVFAWWWDFRKKLIAVSSVCTVALFCHCSLLYILTAVWEWLNSWKCGQHIFEKKTKLCFVKFSYVQEIVSKFCKCQFSIYLSAGTQKSVSTK